MLTTWKQKNCLVVFQNKDKYFSFLSWKKKTFFYIPTVSIMFCRLRIDKKVICFNTIYNSLDGLMVACLPQMWEVVSSMTSHVPPKTIKLSFSVSLPNIQHIEGRLWVMTGWLSVRIMHLTGWHAYPQTASYSAFYIQLSVWD